MRRGLRLAAVLTVVLVALTGFKGRGHGHGGGGGGCSSSSSHHSGSGSGSSSGSGGYSDSDDESSTTGSGSGGSRYRDYDDDDYGDSASSGSSGGTASSNGPQTTVVSCAGKAGNDKSGRPAATVKVRNRSGAADTYLVDMSFQDRDGSTLTSGRADVRVPAGKSRTVRVPLDDPSVSGTVVRCEVVSVL
ncbi:hypothetical protein KN815_28420 [Streptomyces sp. 4503]|uniref:Secreted protein n=1 Tax=Streptomyces niphimycinicus TaxID=2842201 RepID=A0ABS6CLN2_9ACTN|nr:hypothetical protein [Streptomyces niphimycinicus]MBU3867837.1 hypothetical protein [Streptomyces niphimycinicus]